LRPRGSCAGFAAPSATRRRRHDHLPLHPSAA
jgi:hypothetical protein